MLSVDAINVGYGDTQVLFDLSLDVAEGEVVAVVGSNGAGKTTMLKTLAGLLQPKSGTITFEGQDLTRSKAYDVVDHGLVYVPEGRRLFPRMSVRKNLELGAYSPHARAHRDEQLAFVYDLFPVLKEREGQLAGTLSGGQQQMCAIARGLMSRPRLLMLDEVSLGLAPVIVKRVYEAIAEVKNLGMTLLLVEQNVRLALSVADRGYVIQSGSVVLTGTGQELMANNNVRKAYLGL
ncbi:MAG: ABC transporter ATP-binding protein [Alphaproteobacteria bacterium]|nr:ABC transporter ATP-binding protein [Alphaproteobacteria bacterium]MDX5369824.1 ABC transporter ATP-binding protein [Alphaproteobacteria bacterium]